MFKYAAILLIVCSLNLNASQEYIKCDATAGMSDSNVLALSSQPGFCQTYGYEAGKPECTHLSKNSYQANHLTLHGLWPNQNACGQHYGFCGVKQQNHHCDYSKIEFNSEVAENLKRIMPAYSYGSCLERHEWNKHGSCQNLSADDYFSLAIRLATEFNASIFGQYLTQNKGNTVTHLALRERLVDAFGVQSSANIYLGCKNGILVDIYIHLPALLPLSEPLEFLIDKAPNHKYKDACPKKIKISDFNKESVLEFL